MIDLTQTDKYKDDFDFCEKIIKKSSKSFYTAFSALPSEKARSIFAIYAFCREADDSIDEHNDIEELLTLEQNLTFFLKGKTPNAPIWRALEAVFFIFPMKEKAFCDMITGQKMDYSFTQPQSYEDLKSYCYYVAGTVGLMLMPILSENPKNQWEEQAIDLGIAMQITNILRDVGEDFQKDRIYLPVDLMQIHCYSKEDLSASIISENFIELWEDLAKRAEHLYDSFDTSLSYLSKDAKMPVLFASRLYKGILNSVRQNHYDCFTKRNYVNSVQQIKILNQARLDGKRLG